MFTKKEKYHSGRVRLFDLSVIFWLLQTYLFLDVFLGISFIDFAELYQCNGYDGY